MYNPFSYGYGYGYGSNAGALGACGIIALIAGIIIYFTFLSPKNEGKFTGFLGFLHDFLSFKKLLLEAILKVIYLIFAIYMTLAGFVLLFSSFGAGLAMIVFGNILGRLGYEFLLLLVIICKNTSEINKKLSGDKNAKADMFVSNVELPQTMVDQFKQAANKTAESIANATAKSEAPQEGEKFCSNCGQKMKADATFCSNCGQKNE